MPAIRDLTQAQGWSPQDIDHLYLSLGPGSFTGLRIAVAIARAMHQANPALQLIGVPSLDIIAQNAPQEFTRVLPILDAKRTQIFAAQYDRDDHGTLHQTLPAALVDPTEFLQHALSHQSKIKNQKSKIATLGEGLPNHQQALTHFPTITQLPQHLWHAQATHLLTLGYARAQQNQFSNPTTLLPLYIRLPEAEEVYRKNHNLPIT